MTLSKQRVSFSFDNVRGFCNKILAWAGHATGLWERQNVSSRRTERQKKGDWAEAQALQFLQNQGLILLAKQVRRGRGEIDLICQEHDLPVFIEVRYRSKSAWVRAGASIDNRKKNRLVKTAKCIMKERGWLQARFDAVLLDEGKPLVWAKEVIGL